MTGSQTERVTTRAPAAVDAPIGSGAAAVRSVPGASGSARWARISRAVRLAAGSSRSAMVRGLGMSTGMSATTRPGRGDRTTTRSATRIASGMLWVTMTMVVAARSQSRNSSRSKRSRLSASSALNGSSSRSTAGSSARARASATRWAVPPDSSDGRESATAGSRPTRSMSAATRAARGSAAQPARSSGIGDVVGGRAPRQQARLLEDQPDARVGAVDRTSHRAGPCRSRARAGPRSRAAAWTCRSRSGRSGRRSRRPGS